MKSLASILAMLFVAVLSQGEETIEVPSKWPTKDFVVYTGEDVTSKFVWWVGRDFAYLAAPKTSVEIVALFQQQPEKVRKNGMCLVSWTYAVPFNAAEKKNTRIP